MSAMPVAQGGTGVDLISLKPEALDQATIEALVSEVRRCEVLVERRALRRRGCCSRGTFPTQTLKRGTAFRGSHLIDSTPLSQHLQNRLVILPEIELSMALHDYVDKDEKTALQICIDRALKVKRPFFARWVGACPWGAGTVARWHAGTLPVSAWRCDPSTQKGGRLLLYFWRRRRASMRGRPSWLTAWAWTTLSGAQCR